MRRVLLTGAGGFIGRHTLEPLLAAGMEVHALTSTHPPAGAPAGVRWHRADLLAAEAPADLVGEIHPSDLLHLAWYTRPGLYWTASENLDWVQASLRLLRAFGETGGRRAVLAGTCAEYAWGRRTHCVENRPADPGTPTVPATLYGAAKHGLHVVARAWARQTGVALAWGRIFNVYGPHEHPDRLVSGLAGALLRDEQAACSQGTQLRDYIYAPELGAAFAGLLVSDVEGALNMASGEPVRVAEVIAAVAAAIGRPDLVRYGARPTGGGEPESLTADGGRLREEVGWTPSVGLREGVSRTVEWWRQMLAAEPPLEVAPARAGDALGTLALGRVSEDDRAPEAA
jgi:nucleoside-diphosphate-sugar epimerase